MDRKRPAQGANADRVPPSPESTAWVRAMMAVDPVGMLRAVNGGQPAPFGRKPRGV